MSPPPRDSAALEQAIQQAFARGDNATALVALRELAAGQPQNAEVQHRLAVVEEQVGSAERALQAHLKCLRLAPRNPLAYLYAGYCLQQLGRASDALQLWSLGSDLDPAMLRPVTRSDPTGLRLGVASRALRAHFSDLHRRSVSDRRGLRRIRHAVWVQTTDRPFRFRDSRQRPHLFYLPDLPAQPWYELDDEPWAAALRERCETIRQEFLQAQRTVDAVGRPYLGRGMRLGPEFADLQGSLNWTAVDLYRHGIRQAAADQFPQTLQALSRAPLYGLDDAPIEVFFSLLKPGQHIKPHYGLSNHSLTVHLPLVIPADCALTVGGERREWRPGRLLAFDDTYLHEAVNGADTSRVVLIFSIWHPGLSDDERAAITRSFLARNDWLGRRRVPDDGQSGA